MEYSCTPMKTTSGKSRLGVAPGMLRRPTSRKRFDCTISSTMPMARKAEFLTGSPPRGSPPLRGRLPRGLGSVGGRSGDDEHLLEAREVDGGRGGHLLIDAEVALDD